MDNFETETFRGVVSFLLSFTEEQNLDQREGAGSSEEGEKGK